MSTSVKPAVPLLWTHFFFFSLDVDFCGKSCYLPAIFEASFWGPSSKFFVLRYLCYRPARGRLHVLLVPKEVSRSSSAPFFVILEAFLLFLGPHG